MKVIGCQRIILCLMLISRSLCHRVRVNTGPKRNISLTPCDVLWDSTARMALRLLRNTKMKQKDIDPFILSALHPCYHDDGKENRFVTLTLVGDKGGEAMDQINQDRGFIHFRRSKDQDILLAGVSDGHGVSGHFVAEWIRHMLKQQLFVEPLGNKTPVSDIIADTVKTMDKLVPNRFAFDSGATLSFLFRIGETLYFSNTGDSQTYLAAAVLDESNELVNVDVVFASELHKPTASVERKRLKSLGHRIDEEEDRVWYIVGNQEQGMATSRTIGDRQARSTLIPDPDIVKFTIADVMKNQNKKRQKRGGAATERVHLFAVSATDGIIDYFTPEKMAYPLALALYEGTKNLITTTEDIVNQSAVNWVKEMNGQYRDDITITVAHIC